MCQNNLTGPYPCGHVTSTWDNCLEARARSLLSTNPLQAPSKKTPSPCRAPLVVEWPAKLDTACARTCLTRPFQCCRCVLSNRSDGEAEQQQPQVGWTCERCSHVRCRSACSVWTGCGCARCHGAFCRGLVLQLAGDVADGKKAQACGVCLEGACDAQPKV